MLDSITSSVNGCAMTSVVRDLRERVFRVLPPDSQESAEKCLDVDEPPQMPEVRASPRFEAPDNRRVNSVPLKRCASSPAVTQTRCLGAGAVVAVLPSAPGSAPTSPRDPTSTRPLVGRDERPTALNQPPAKKHSPPREGLLYKCALCGLATFSELELNEEGDAFVHKGCGTWVQLAPGISLDRERNCRADEDAPDAARADRAAVTAAPFYATLRDKCSAAVANSSRVGNGSKRSGLAQVQNLATEDAVRRQHAVSVVNSKEASRLRQVLKKVAEVLDTQREADVELLQSCNGLAERLFVQAAHKGIGDDLMQYSALVVAVTCVRREIAERAGDKHRRSAPSFNRMQKQIAGRFPDGLQGAPMQEKAVALLVDRVLGECEALQVRPPSRTATTASSAADDVAAETSSVSASATSAVDEDDCFF